MHEFGSLKLVLGQTLFMSPVIFWAGGKARRKDMDVSGRIILKRSLEK
jgi:hypothetical protein